MRQVTIFWGLSQKLLHKPRSRAVDPQSFFADPDPAVLLNADPDPSAFVMRIQIRIQLNFYKTNYLMKSFLELKKIHEKKEKINIHGAGPNVLYV